MRDSFEGMIIQKLAEEIHEGQKRHDEWMAQEIANRVGKTLFG
jgi:hypothetical protein